MPLQAGRLRKKIFLLKQTATQDTFGEYVPTYTSIGRFWGSVEPINARERFSEGANVGSTTHRVMIRYKGNLDSTYTLLFERSEHEVLAANITDVATTITVDSGSEIGTTAPFYARIGSEIVQVTAGWGTTSLTISRGKFGTTAAAHLADSKLFKLNILNVTGAMNHREKNESIEFLCEETTDPFDG